MAFNLSYSIVFATLNEHAQKRFCFEGIGERCQIRSPVQAFLQLLPLWSHPSTCFADTCFVLQILTTVLRLPCHSLFLFFFFLNMPSMFKLFGIRVAGKMLILSWERQDVHVFPVLSSPSWITNFPVHGHFLPKTGRHVYQPILFDVHRHMAKLFFRLP